MNASAPNQYSFDNEGDSALIRACVAGESSARTTFFNKYRELIYKFTYRFVGPVADIDDLVHDIFVEVYRSLNRFKGDSKFTTWLYRVAANVSMVHLKKARRRAYVFVPYESPDAIGWEKGASIDGEEVFAQRQIRRRIGEALLKLHEKKRIVLVLHDIEGRTMEEIGVIVKKPVGTVKSRLFHARSEMRNILKDLMSGRNV